MAANYFTDQADGKASGVAESGGKETDRADAFGQEDAEWEAAIRVGAENRQGRDVRHWRACDVGTHPAVGAQGVRSRRIGVA